MAVLVADDHLRLMDGWGVSRSILSISSPGVHFGNDEAACELAGRVNEAGARQATERPDRFGLFAALPLPDVDGALRTLAHALDDLGSEGVTVLTNAGGVYLGDPRYEPLYDELNRRHAVVFVHPTSPPGAARTALGRPRPMLEFLFDSTRTVSDLVLTGTLSRYPDISWVFTHGGGTLPLLVDRMDMFRTAVLADGGAGPTIAQQVAGFWFDIAGTPFPHQVPALAAAFGTDRLLYGSDYCFTLPAGVDAQLASIGAAHQPAGSTYRALTTRNAQRLFGLL